VTAQIREIVHVDAFADAPHQPRKAVEGVITARGLTVASLRSHLNSAERAR